MNFVLILAALVGVCQAATFTHVGGVCGYPTWECHCKLVYDCDGDGEFPVNLDEQPASVAGYFKDLAPKEYPMRISGKTWRRNRENQEDFCERECLRRLSVHLCLDKDPSAYSDPAMCMKLLAITGGPFQQDGSPEPCCSVYLEYGLQWCDRKWNEELTTLRCLSRGVDPSFGTTSPASDVHHIFSVESECTADGTMDYTWCDSAPTCPSPGP